MASTMMKILLYGGAAGGLVMAVGAAYAFHRYSVRNRQSTEQGFIAHAAQAVAEWYATSGRGERAEIDAWFRSLFSRSQTPPPVPLTSVEIVTSRVGSTAVRTQIVLLIPEGQGAKRVTLEFEDAWHNLPQEYRENFMRNNEEQITYTLWTIEQTGEA